MNILIIIIDVIGILAFMGATYHAYKNYERLKEASHLWLYFGTASIVAIMWGISYVLSEFNVKIAIQYEPVFFFAVIFLFTLVSMSSLFDFIKLQGSFK
ncbi:MAG: hypothetical protein V1740_02460 [Candidatus Woesearchaeota archaeon]